MAGLGSTLAMIAVASFFCLGAGADEIGRLKFTGDLTYASEYMTDGFDIGGGLPVWEPSLQVDLGSTGFSMMSWSAIQIERENRQFDEYDVFLNYAKSAFSGSRHEMRFSAYFDYWIYPNTPPTLDDFGNEVDFGEKKGNKLHAGISFPKAIPLAGSYLVPAYNIYYWLYWAENRWDMYEGGAHHEFLLEYDHIVPRFIPGARSQFVSASGSVNYNDGAFGVTPGWSHSVIGLTGGAYALGSIFRLSLNHQFAFEPGLFFHDETWTTLSFTKEL